MKTDYFVKATNLKDGSVNYYLNAIDVARHLGCSKQLVYQVLSDKEHFKHFKSAKNWKLEWIDAICLVDKNVQKKLVKVL